MPGTLYVVATPVGNLEDITFRAVRILRECTRVAAEDTRQTRKLLDHYGVATELVSCHEHNEDSRARQLVEQMLAGDSVAYVTDAGTPLISDPGARLVRAAISAGIRVEPVPGACAAIAALSAAGLPAERFFFAGFPAPKSGQRLREFEALRDRRETLVFHEAPHRILETLTAAEEIFGPDRPAAVAREITKLHEEFVRGTIAEVRRELAGRPSIKGEIVLLIGPAPERPVDPAGPDEVRARVRALIDAGTPRMDAIKETARALGRPKREVYAIAEELLK